MRHDENTIRIEQAEETIAYYERILRKVDRALNALSDADRILVMAHYIEGKSWKEKSSSKFYSAQLSDEKTCRNCVMYQDGYCNRDGMHWDRVR